MILKCWISEYKVTSDIPKDIPFPPPIWHMRRSRTDRSIQKAQISFVRNPSDDGMDEDSKHRTMGYTKRGRWMGALATRIALEQFGPGWWGISYVPVFGTFSFYSARPTVPHFIFGTGISGTCGWFLRTIGARDQLGLITFWVSAALAMDRDSLVIHTHFFV